MGEWVSGSNGILKEGEGKGKGKGKGYKLESLRSLI